MKLVRLVPIVTLLSASCGGAEWKQVPHDRVHQRAAPPKLHAPPTEIPSLVWWESFYNSSFAQVSAGVSPGAYLEPALGPRPALDINAFGKVPDSPWFENRLGRHRLSMADMIRGPNTSSGPAPGPLTVLSAKTEGVTPGLMVVDHRGDKWVVKFDPPAHPSLASGAEVITTKLMHAAGYHVPENYISTFRIEDLFLSPEATTRDRYNRKVGLSRETLEDAITQLNPEPDGEIRALFSRFLPGKMLGPSPYIGVRKGDPNDRIPHVQRRSLRGLWVFYAWVNNSDTKSANTMDAFIPSQRDPSLGHVRHYLFDFGSTLGAAGNTTKPLREGYDYEVDWARIGARFVTAGSYYPYWSTLRRTPYRSVGPFESRIFDPGKWKPRHVNPAFVIADDEDTFWAASILASFRNDLIGAAVSTGGFTEPGATLWVVKTLIERRNKILAYAFRKMLPLDHPRIMDGHRVVLDDLERAVGLRPREFSGYRWNLIWERNDGTALAVAAGSVQEPSVFLRAELAWLRRVHGAALRESPFLSLAFRDGAGKRDAVTVRLRSLSDGSLMVVGLDR